MAYDNPKGKISLPANADLSASQYCFATVNSSGKAIINATLGGAVLGVLQNNPDAVDKVAEIACEELCKVKAAAAIVPGNLVASDATGKAVVATSGQYALGIALSTAASGEFVTIMILNLGKV